MAAEVFDAGRVATHVGVTVRTASFFTRTKTAKLSAPTTDPEEVRRGALRVLERFDLDRPVRLTAYESCWPTEPDPSGETERPSEK